MIEVTVRVEITRQDGTRSVSEETALTDSGNPRFEAHQAWLACAAATDKAVGRLGDPLDVPANGVAAVRVAATA